MAKKDTRDNTLLRPGELQDKIENDLIEQGVISQTSQEVLREKVQDVFDYYPDVDFLWVTEDGTAFLQKDVNFASNHANHTKQKLYKILRNG